VSFTTYDHDEFLERYPRVRSPIREIRVIRGQNALNGRLGVSDPTHTTISSDDTHESALPFVRFVLFIDLNPVAAGLAAVPEASEHASIKKRVDHIGPGPDRGPESGPDREHCRIGRIGEAGGFALALADRGSAPAGFVA